MKIEKNELSRLRKEIENTKLFIEELQKTMKNIPEGSALGRLSIASTIWFEERRLKRMEVEFEKRIREEGDDGNA